METIEALIIEENNKHFIEIATEGDVTRIPISEDQPKEVKSAFNKLIKRIKQGEFEIHLKNIEENLFTQVARAYITQLNREIQEVRHEMIQYGLVEEDDDDSF